MVSKELLELYGAEIRHYQKDEFIFHQGHKARYYFQVVNGEVKMNNYLENGKEFIQNFFLNSESFGEPPLFINIKYPANAIAVSNATIIELPKKKFLTLLKEHPEVHLKITQRISSRLYYKAIMASEIAAHEPEHCILRIIDYLKHDVYKMVEPFSYKVELTRQQLADLTGLRVETVIRVTKSLEKKNELVIKNRKLYR